MTNRPVGTVTFLFTDVEGSTRAWEAFPAETQTALKRHDEIVAGKIEAPNVHSFLSVAKVIASLQFSAVPMMPSQPPSRFSVSCAHKRGRLTCRYVSAWQFTLVKPALIIVGRTLIAPRVFARLHTASRF